MQEENVRKGCEPGEPRRPAEITNDVGTTTGQRTARKEDGEAQGNKARGIEAEGHRVRARQEEELELVSQTAG